jgi:hypothetical protein
MNLPAYDANAHISAAADAPLGLFFLLVLGIVALPGLDMAYVMAHALSGGRKLGFAAVGGIVAGGVARVPWRTPDRLPRSIVPAWYSAAAP